MRFLTGRHTETEIRWHLAIVLVGYWGLVLCAWLGYPAERAFSVRTHFLSALGSFDAHENPDWHWVFNMAMILCGLGLVPVACYVRNRFGALSRRGANAGLGLQLIGCLGITCIGLFPYGKGQFVGLWEFRTLHLVACALIVCGFGAAVVWHAALLIRARVTARTLGPGALRRFVGPYLVVLVVLLSALGYEGRHLIRGLATRGVLEFQGVPILEHIAIWGLTAYIVWFTIAASSALVDSSPSSPGQSQY